MNKMMRRRKMMLMVEVKRMMKMIR